MTKRYGRNQRRKHREEIAALQAELKVAREKSEEWGKKAWHHFRRAERMAVLAQQSEEHAFQRFMRASGLLRQVMDRVATQIANVAGEQLVKDFASVAPHRHEGVTPVYLASRTPVGVRTVGLALPAVKVCYDITDQDLRDAV